VKDPDDNPTPTTDRPLATPTLPMTCTLSLLHDVHDWSGTCAGQATRGLFATNLQPQRRQTMSDVRQPTLPLRRSTTHQTPQPMTDEQRPPSSHREAGDQTGVARAFPPCASTDSRWTASSRRRQGSVPRPNVEPAVGTSREDPWRARRVVLESWRPSPRGSRSARHGVRRTTPRPSARAIGRCDQLRAAKNYLARARASTSPRLAD